MQVVLFLLAGFVAFTVQSVAGFGGPLIAMPIGIALLGVKTVKPAITFAAWLSAALVAVPDVAALAVAKVPEVLPEESAVAVAPAASAPDVVPPRVEPPVPKSPIE